MTPEQLKALGVEDQDTAAENAFARILLLGPAKAGKTTCVAATAPKPLIINADGASATKGAKNLGGKFLVVEAYNQAQLKKALVAAQTLVKSGDVRTVVLDTITLLADNLLDEMGIKLQGHDLWGQYVKVLTSVIKTLCALEAHVFVIGHLSPKADTEAGVMPAIAGSAKVKIPAMLDDWIFLDADPNRKPERQFLLGAQKAWNAGGRNIRKACAIEANVPALFEQLGLKL